MSDTPSEAAQGLEARVLAWLQKEGYPFEFECAQDARNVGLSAQLGYYSQADDEVSREIDVFAGVEPIMVERPNRLQISVLANLFVECKYSKPKPWIVLCQDQALDLFSALAAVQMTDVAMSVVWKRFVSRSLKFEKCPWITGAKFPAVGFSVVEAFRAENRDVPFGAIEKVAEATRTYVGPGLAQVSAKLSRVNFTAMAMCYACVAVDAPLFAASLSPLTGQMEIRPVRRALVVWKHTKNTLVWLVTREDFKGFVGEIASAMSEFQTFARVAAEAGEADGFAFKKG